MMVDSSKENVISQQEKEEIILLIEGTIKQTEALLDKVEMQQKMIKSLEKQLDDYRDREEKFDTQYQEQAEEIISQAKKDADYIVYDALVQAEKIELGAASIKRESLLFKESLKRILEREWKVLQELDYLQEKDQL